MFVDIQENIKRFRFLMRQIHRDGIDALLDYIENKTDFYSAPASTNFHLCVEGGLLQHSLNVYNCLIAKKNNPIWKSVFEDISDESLIIMALLHDICKTNMYVKGFRNQKTYEIEKIAQADKKQIKHDDNGDFIWETVQSFQITDNMPLGHGEKSVILTNCFMKLNTKEIFAIRWHMGFSEERSQYKSVGESMERYPIVLALHEADLEASKIIEGNFDNKVQIYC